MITIDTKRFGRIEIADPRIVIMREGGILGFSHLREFVLLNPDEKKLFWWLQSLEDGNITFLVTNPFMVCPDYELDIPSRDTEILNITDREDVVVLSIVTVNRARELKITANLRAPIIINAKEMIARQVVLERDDYDIRYEVKGMRKNAQKDDVERIKASCTC
ncbi:MAG: flagellar assembly protein FliW [Syntrophales bacterium]|nr:flagellar assembly protein FliW [Syntrophales bacterium]